MSDTIDNDLERKSGSPSLLDAFEDSDFDALWDSSLGKAAESTAEPAQPPTSKLGGLDVNWASLGDGDFDMPGVNHSDNQLREENASDREGENPQASTANDAQSHRNADDGDLASPSKSSPHAESSKVDASKADGAETASDDSSAIDATPQHNRVDASEKQTNAETQQIQMTPEMLTSLISLQNEGIQAQRSNAAFKREASLLIDTQDFESPDAIGDSPALNSASTQDLCDEDEEETKVISPSASTQDPCDEDEEETKVISPSVDDLRVAREIDELEKDNSEIHISTELSSTTENSEKYNAEPPLDDVVRSDDAKPAVDDGVESSQREASIDAKPAVDDGVESSQREASIDAKPAVDDDSSRRDDDALNDDDSSRRDDDGARDAKESDDAELDSENLETDEISSEDEDGKPRIRVNSFEAIETFDDSCRESCLSDRARMGNFSPEGEVVTAEHEIKRDVKYDDKDCENGVDLDYVRQHRRKKLLLAAIAFMVAVLACAVAYLAYIKVQEPSVNYAQRAAFQVGSSGFDRYTTTRSGDFRAACSDSRGVVLNRDNALVAEFWPMAAGCVDVRLSEDGRKVWFVDSVGILHEVHLEKEPGFASKEIALLTDFLNVGFEVDNGFVRWFAAGENGAIFRSLALANGTITEEALPPNAKVCSGFVDNRYAYVSGESIYMNENGKTTSASLMTAKLGCTLETVLDCAYDGNGGWAVLCNNSVHIGQDGSNQAQVQLKDNTAVRAGAVNFNLLRHAHGADFITPNEWLHINGRGKASTKTFKQTLGISFDLVYAANDEMPLRGIIGNRFKEITTDGDVVDNFPTSPMTHVGGAFVAGGNYVFALFNDAKMRESRGVVWDLLAGRLVDVKDFPNELSQIHISNDGRTGFVIAESAQKRKSLTWLSFPTLNELGTEQLTSPVVSVDWSDDGAHAMLHFESGASRLYAITEKAVTAMRNYDANVVVAIGHNDLIWRISDGNVVFERIDTGALSVINEQLTTALRGQKIRAITLALASDDVLFWGDSGLWSYDVARPQLNRIIDTPVKWVSPDRTGKWVATSAGLVDMTTLGLVPNVPLQKHSSIDWLGHTEYALSRDRRTIFDFSKMTSYEVKNTPSLPFIGRGMDLHPDNNFLLGSRDDLTVLAQILPDTMSAQDDIRLSILAVMSGHNANSWCWRMAKDGATQGNGSACVSFVRTKDGAAAPIKIDNPPIAKTMHEALSQQKLPAQMYAPYAFVDDVALSIETVPAQSSVFFVVSNGTLPAPLVSESGFLPAPVKTTLKRADINIGVAVTAPQYELRALSFTPNTAVKSIRVPLLHSGAKDITVKGYDFDEDDKPIAADLSDDIRFELASLLHAKRTEISTCLTSNNANTFSLWVDENGALTAKTPNAAALDACLAPIVTYLEDERKKGALPELSTLALFDLRLDITLP